MSILIIEVLSEGIIFGADRNITSTYTNGTTLQNSQCSKVFKWPNDEILFGSVGNAEINGRPINEWLNSIKSDFDGMQSIEEISKKLSSKIEEQRRSDEGSNPARPFIAHLGGFVKKVSYEESYWVPEIWFIRNTHKLGKYKYLDYKKGYLCTEEFWKYFENIDISEIRKVLKVQAKRFDPFWFHQGLDLLTFNVLQNSIKSSFKLLCESHPDHDIPTNLTEWSKHVKMQILMYGSYFEAFHSEGKRFVGGGADIIFIPWPS